jgi:hypothetical protein
METTRVTVVAVERVLTSVAVHAQGTPAPPVVHLASRWYDYQRSCSGAVSDYATWQ